MNIFRWYSLSRKLFLYHIPLIPGIIKLLIRVLWSAVIPYQADIGTGTFFGYQGLSIVIHKRCIIGNNCHISQNVTIGGTSGLYGVPILGNGVIVGTGAVIIGPVIIGDNVVIGANAVVNIDLPDNCVAAGVPVRILKRKSTN